MCIEKPGSMERGATSPEQCKQWCEVNMPVNETNPLQLYDVYLPTGDEKGLPECRCFYKEKDSCDETFNSFSTIYYAG